MARFVIGFYVWINQYRLAGNKYHVVYTHFFINSNSNSSTIWYIHTLTHLSPAPCPHRSWISYIHLSILQNGQDSLRRNHPFWPLLCTFGVKADTLHGDRYIQAKQNKIGTHLKFDRKRFFFKVMNGLKPHFCI